jgi:hypothetical protein
MGTSIIFDGALEAKGFRVADAALFDLPAPPRELY